MTTQDTVNELDSEQTARDRGPMRAQLPQQHRMPQPIVVWQQQLQQPQHD